MNGFSWINSILSIGGTLLNVVYDAYGKNPDTGTGSYYQNYSTGSQTMTENEYKELQAGASGTGSSKTMVAVGSVALVMVAIGTVIWITKKRKTNEPG